MLKSLFIILPITGIVIGVVGAFVAMRKYVKQ